MIRREVLALFVLAAAGWLPAGAAETPRLSLDVHARALAPGEPLRIVVRAVQPLDEVSGTLQDESLFFVGAGPGREWSAWTVIDLDHGPGKVTLTVEGRTASAEQVRMSRVLTISKKKFPIQRLNVPEKFVTPPPEIEERIERETKKLAALYASRSPRPTPGEPFIRPVPGDQMGVFGARRFFNGQPRSPHPGLDLRAAAGTPVSASGQGRVVLAEDLYFSGKTIIIEHGGGLFTLYAHLSEMRVEEGDEPRKGQVIGLSGSTGRVTGPHLHWGAKVGNRPFDPTALLAASLFR